MSKISDELLSSFLEGNTTPEETLQVLDAIKQDKQLQETIRISRQVDHDLDRLDYEILPLTAKAALAHANRCAMECELYVLKKHGVEHSYAEWEKTSREQGLLKEDGTALYNIGRRMEGEGFSVSRTFHNEIEDISNALEKETDVIVVLDRHELKGDWDMEKLRDEFQGETPNHAVVVLAVGEQTVRIYDPADGKEAEIGRLRFIDAWNDSSNYMVTIKERNYKDYVPHPIDLSDIELDDSLIELREAIAENAHEVWAENRKKQGWTYGPKRNDILKETPDMVPYSDLPDSEKLYDREMAIKTIKLLKKLGWDIQKKK